MVQFRETVIVGELERVAQQPRLGPRRHAPMELDCQRHATGTQQRAVEVEIRRHERIRPGGPGTVTLDGEQRQRLVMRHGACLPCDRGRASSALSLELAQQPARFLWFGPPDRHAKHPRAAARCRDEGPDPAAALHQPELHQAV
jgi:hypothetical protein